MGDNKGFWNRYASIYDFEISRFNAGAYAEMYRLMSESLMPHMDVLEVATGTGLVAINVAGNVCHVQATDYSPKMIEKAKGKKYPGNVSFSVEDATALSFVDGCFDAVIISNALHIMPDPVRALSEVARVLRPHGLLVAPTISQGHIADKAWNRNRTVLKLLGYEAQAPRWTPNGFVEFIRQNGFDVARWRVLQAAFPLVYLEAYKAAGCNQ